MAWLIQGKAPQKSPRAYSSPSGARREKAICMVVNGSFFQNMGILLSQLPY